MGPDRTAGPREGTQHLRAAKKTRVPGAQKERKRGEQRLSRVHEVQGRERT